VDLTADRSLVRFAPITMTVGIPNVAKEVQGMLDIDSPFRWENGRPVNIRARSRARNRSQRGPETPDLQYGG